MFIDYYELLDIEPNASQFEIKSAYRRRARESHPDLHPNDNGAQSEEMRLLNEAYTTLSNPRKRLSYDIEWKNHYRQKGEARRAELGFIDSSEAHAQANSFTDKMTIMISDAWSEDRSLILTLLVLLIVLLIIAVNRL